MSPGFPRLPRGHLAVVATVLALACSDASVMEPTADSGPAEGAGTATPSVSGPLADVGEGLALALADAELRQQVLEDMRDSPFPEHSLHLQSYLASDGGRDLAARAARELGISAGELRGRLEGEPDLQFFMPNTYQRGTWEGEGPVTVIATLLSDEVVASRRLPAWSSDGRTSTIAPSEALKSPTLAIFPARHDFGRDPAAALQAAGERDRSTVGSKGALRVHGTGEARTPDELEGLAPAATGDGGYAPGEAGLREWMSWFNCRMVGDSNDLDEDGLIDNCEEKLARAFRPLLWFDHDEQLESRETYWALRVQDFSQRKIFIFYALGYHDDKTHAGDSEFIQLRVVHESGRWKLLWADYSAHFQATNDASATYSYRELDYPGRYRGRPIALVAHGKHGSYNSFSECGDGLLNFDECGFGFSENVRSVAIRNLGGLYGTTQPLVNCVDSQQGSASHGHGLPGTECFWSGAFFDGWHSTSDGTKSYGDILEYFGWKTRDLAPGSSSPNPCPDDDDPVLELPECS